MSQSTTNTVLLRAKDIGLLIMILTFFGMLAGPLKKVFQLDDTISKVARLEDDMNRSKVEIAVTISQYADITRQLEQINWQLRRLNQK